MDMTLDEMKTKYISLQEVYRTLVGALYPSIVYRELYDLRVAYVSAGGSNDDLPWTPPPHLDGRAPY